MSGNGDFVASRITSSCQLMANCSLLHQSVYALHCDSCECTLPDGCRSANATSSNRQRTASCETEGLALYVLGDCTVSGRMAVPAQHHHRGHRLRRRMTQTQLILMNTKTTQNHKSHGCVSAVPAQQRELRRTAATEHETHTT